MGKRSRIWWNLEWIAFTAQRALLRFVLELRGNLIAHLIQTYVPSCLSWLEEDRAAIGLDVLLLYLV